MDVWKKKFSIAESSKITVHRNVWMKASKYVDVKENTAIITFHNTKVIPNTIVTIEQELRKKEQDVCNGTRKCDY